MSTETNQTPEEKPVDGEQLTSLIHDALRPILAGKDVFDVCGAMGVVTLSYIVGSVPVPEQQGVYNSFIKQLGNVWPKVRVLFHHVSQ